MKSYRNVIFLVLSAIVPFCQVSFADQQSIETETEDTVAVVLDSFPDDYTNEEIDAKLAQVRDAIPVIPNRYSNDEIDSRIVAAKNSIPAIPDLYSKEEINNRINTLNDAIIALEIALSNIRKSIPAEIKWPVKTKKILTDIRNGIPADIAGTTE